MNKLGITKIEVLVVALIIGVLGIMSVVAISTARSSARDAVRLSDVRQVQTGLELYFNDVSHYPVHFELLPLGTPSTACLGESGFSSACVSANESVYLEAVGAPPVAGLNKQSSCADLNNAYCYIGANGEYRIQFELENRNALLQLQKGINCATETGMESGPCDSLSSSAEIEIAL